jgi:putative ABC transport system substrate-binding protein
MPVVKFFACLDIEQKLPFFKAPICFIIGIISLFVSPLNNLRAAEIAIIKSNNITPYNQAIAGFKQQVKADFEEYDLRGEPDKIDEVVEKIRQQPPRLIFALGALAAVKTKEHISDIPIIYTLVLAPEDKGLIGENLTGISIEVSAREQLSAFQRVVSGIKRIGVLYSHLTEKLIVQARENCAELGVGLVAVKLEKAEDVPDGINDLLPQIDSLWLVPDRIVVNRDSLRYILLLTLENQIPFMVYSKNFVKAGALLSLTVNYTSIGRQTGKMVQQVLQGKSLPSAVIPPEEVEYAINLNVAQNMGLQVPAHILETYEYVYK